MISSGGSWSLKWKKMDGESSLDLSDLSCVERGVRVQDVTPTIERKGGEYFHCSKCNEHFHADVNAARNIMHVQQSKPSAVPGGTA
jgi:hypothetical protein